MNELAGQIATLPTLLGRGDLFEWIVPIVFFIIYGLGALAKRGKKAQENKKTQDESFGTGTGSRTGQGQGQKPRYKPIDQAQSGRGTGGEQFDPTVPRRAKNLPYAPSPIRQRAEQRAERQSRPSRKASSSSMRGEPEAVSIGREAAGTIKSGRGAAQREAAMSQERADRLRASKAAQQRKQQTADAQAQVLAAQRYRQQQHDAAATKKAEQQAAAKQAAASPSLLERLTRKNNLRAAIIYSEILGKPVALRDPM